MRVRTLSDVSLYLAAALLACATDAAAATRTWVGGAGEFWSTPANWQGGNVPGNGDDVVINVGAATTSRNDLNDLHLNSIVLNGQVHLLGIAFGLGAGGLHVAGGPPQVQIRILLDADQVWTIAGQEVSFSTADFGLEPNSIELSGHTLTLNLAGSGMRVFSRIAGAGALVKNGVGALTTSGLDIYTGVTTINGGMVIAMGPLGVEDGTHANGTVVNAGGTLDLHCGSNEALSLAGAGVGGVTVLRFNGVIGICDIDGPITLASDVVLDLFTGFVHPPRLNGPISGPGRLGLDNTGALWLANTSNTFAGVTFGVSGHPGSTLRVGANNALPTTLALEITAGATLDLFGNAQTLASLSGAGTLTSSFPTAGLTLNGAGTTTFSGTITSTPITYMGAGHQTFGSSSNTTLSVQSGLATIAGGSFSAGVGVGSGGRLSLTANGQAGPLNVNGGQLLLSEGGAALGRSGNIFMSAGSVEIGGSLAGALGRLNTTGTVSIQNSTLVLSLPPGFTTPVGTTFTIIDNDGTDPIGGTFTGLPEGGLMPVADWAFQISYVGGDGNDVTLTSVPPPVDYLLTEGATGGFFSTDLLLANPNDQAASIRITFLREGAPNIVVNDMLPAKSHKRIPVQNIAGMESTAFSTVVRSIVGLPLIVERTMSWDSTRYAAHTEHATTGAATTWYFAEGSQGFFHTYLLLSNPNATKTKATVQYLRESETTPLTREYDVEPGSRFTVDASGDTELVNRSFAMVVMFDQPGAAERAMYFGDAPLFNGGHGSAGVTAPSTTWFLAEGATGPFFETFILLANPGDRDADVTLTYLPASGSPITAKRNVPAYGRVTVNLEGEDPTLTNAPVSTQVVSTQPILVERSQYWPDPAPTWYEAHNSFGVTALDTKWGLAEGRVGGANSAQTYILLANPGTATANVEITFLRADGAAPVTKTFTVNPTSRFNVTVGPGTLVPEIANETFGARIISDQPIAVERALYWDANGQTFAAGTNATASRLP